MNNREELNAEQMENVVGGAFTYYNKEGGGRYCVVDKYGTWDCTSDARDLLAAYRSQHQTCTVQDMINYALSKKIFW